MNFLKRLLIFISVLLSFSEVTKATHIVGGELYYEYIGINTYRITLIVYRDCETGVPPFDNPASIGVFNSNNGLLQNIIEFVEPDSVYIPPTINSPCFIPPTNVCYVMAYYTRDIILPPTPGGYQLAYQRCCRNYSILNIVNPLDHGITIYANIPGSANNNYQNSNPQYIQTQPQINIDDLPPPFICLGVPFEFDHSAIDADGDSVAYELCTPFDGGEPFPCGPNPQPCGPAPSPPFNPPYNQVQWQFPFGPGNLLGGVPLTINPITGLLACTPNTIGQFVIGVCAKEFRNGVLISTTRRDYQLNVVACPSLVVAALQNPIINCNSTTVVFQNQSSGAATYLWNFGDPTTTNDVSTAVNPSYNYPDTGTYTVTLIAYSSLTGCSDTTVGTVHIYPQFNADFTFTTFPCILDVAFLSTSLNIGSGFSNSWSWNFGDNTTSNLQNPVHTYASGGTFNVTLITTSDSGCVDTIVKQIILVQQLSANVSVSAPPTCSNDCNAASTAVALNGIPPFTYQWSDPNNQTTATASNLCAGTYTVLITDSNNCTVVKTITIGNPTLLSSNISSTDAYCGGLCIGTTTSTVSGGVPPYSYSWSDPLNQQTQSATGLCLGNYSVLVTDANGCTLTNSVFVDSTSYFPPFDATVSDDTIYQGQLVQLFSTVYQNASYSWSPFTFLSNATISNPTASPLEPVGYLVEFADSNGCPNRDSVFIFVKETFCKEPELFIPNAFTPNDDGKNDILYVRGNTIKELLLRIYNRWGEKVFETTNPNTGWDGKYKNEFSLPGVYDYYFEATCYNNEKFFKKGNVTVIR